MLKRAVSGNGLVAALFYEEGRTSKVIIMLGDSEGAGCEAGIQAPV